MRISLGDWLASLTLHFIMPIEARVATRT